MNKNEIKVVLNNFINNDHNEEDVGRCCILSGPWGVGKTYLINEIISENKQHQFAIVSLFGINSVEDLKIRIISDICKSSSKAAKAIKLIMDSVSFSFGLGSSASISINMSKLGESLEKYRVRRKLKKNKKQYVVVLDDIERKDFRLTISEVLGTVDELLKNKNLKVILVTNFDKIKLDKECDEFKEFKEKITKHTYELNDIDEVVSTIIDGENKYLNGKNIRTINLFKDLLSYISSCSIDYPLIVKQIIYHILRVEKEKVDIYKGIIEHRKNNRGIFMSPSDDEIEGSVRRMTRNEAIREYVLCQIKLIENEKQYTLPSVTKVIDYVYASIYEGNDNRLLSIPELQYGVFIDVIPISQFENDEKSIISCIERFDNAFITNNINYKKTALDYCNFVYSYYSANSSNDIIRQRFDDSMKTYVAIVVNNSMVDPNVCAEVFDGINKALREHSSNKFANKMNGDIRRIIYAKLVQGPYNDDSCFMKNIKILNSFFDIKNKLPSELFSGFDTTNKQFMNGLDYIFDKCKKAINSEEWETYRIFFSILNITNARSNYKEYARKLLKSGGIASERFKELISLIN